MSRVLLRIFLIHCGHGWILSSYAWPLREEQLRAPASQQELLDESGKLDELLLSRVAAGNPFLENVGSRANGDRGLRALKLGEKQSRLRSGRGEQGGASDLGADMEGEDKFQQELEQQEKEQQEEEEEEQEQDQMWEGEERQQDQEEEMDQQGDEDTDEEGEENQQQQQELDEELRLAAPPPEVREALDRRHQQVSRLEREGEELKAEGKGLQEAHLESVSRMVDGTTLMRQIVESRAHLKNLQAKLDALEADASQLSEKHAGLQRKLQDAMATRLEASIRKVTAQDARLAKAKTRMEKWEEKLKQQKQLATDMIHKRRVTQESLHELDDTIQKLEQQRDALMKEYGEIRDETAESIGTYHYVKAHFDAISSKTKLLTKRAAQQRSSYDRLVAIYKADSQQLDKSLARGEDQLNSKMHAMLAKVEKENHTLTSLQNEYLSWKAAQKQHEQKLAERKATFEKSWRAHADRRYDLMKSAQAEAAKKAAAASGWAVGDDWANEDGLDGFNVYDSSDATNQGQDMEDEADPPHANEEGQAHNASDLPKEDVGET